MEAREGHGSGGALGNFPSSSSFALRADALSRNELTDRRALSPLRTDYDGIIEMLKGQIDTYRADQNELRSRIGILVAENDRLNQKLTEAIRSQMEFASGVDGSAAMGDSGILENIQNQLSMALQEKDVAVEMWHSSMQEIEKLERQLESARLDPRVQSVEFQAQQIKEQYVKNVTELSQQNTQLQEELKKTRNNLKISNIQVVDLRNALEDLRKDMVAKERERSNNEVRHSSLEKNFKDASRQLSDLNAQVVNRALEIDELRREKQILEQQLVELNSRTSDAEIHTTEALNRLRDSFQMVEKAVTERDEALIKENQSQEEIERLQSALSKLVDEAGVRTRQEVDNVKKQYNVNLSKLLEEMQRLELETSEKTAEIERTLREKRAIESELEKIYREGILQGGKEGAEFHDLTLRACNAERSLDEAQLKIDSLSTQIRRMETINRQEVSRLEMELESIRDRNKVLNDEMCSTNDDRVKLTEKVDELKHQMHRLQQEKDSSLRAATKQVGVLSQEMQIKEKEYEAKLQSIEDSHRHKMIELREMITVQQRMSSKWKEECNLITQRMELKLNDSRSELSNERRRTEELTRLLRECRNKTVEMEAKMQQYSQNILSLQSKCADHGQNRSMSSSPKAKLVQVETAGSSSLIESRRQQQREIEFNLRHSMSPLTYSAGLS